MPDLQRIVGILDRQDAWGNPLWRWLLAVLAALLLFVIFRGVLRVLVRQAERLAERSRWEWFEDGKNFLGRTKSWFLLSLAALCGMCFLHLPANVWRIGLSVVIIVILLQAAVWADGLIHAAIARQARLRRETDAAGATTLAALGFIARLAVWTAVLLLAMANLGINITAMLAGLGIGGVAVALAAQNILGDLFASISIVLDRPFVLGDFIVVDDKKGTVEYIGLKTTRLRSLSGEQLVFSNADLLKSRIHNYQRMAERRVVFTVDVAYETPCEKLAAVPRLLREAVETQQAARFERAHFARFGEYSLVFEVVYHVRGTDYTLYMDVQQAINFAVFRRFGEEGIEFAYPTRTIYHRGWPKAEETAG